MSRQARPARVPVTVRRALATHCLLCNACYASQERRCCLAAATLPATQPQASRNSQLCPWGVCVSPQPTSSLDLLVSFICQGVTLFFVRDFWVLSCSSYGAVCRLKCFATPLMSGSSYRRFNIEGGDTAGVISMSIRTLSNSGVALAL
jgi:hypothetical protein